MADTGTTSADTTPSTLAKIPRKRKADELSDDSGDPAAATAAEDVSAPAHLPAPVWGHVLDFMAYADVRSALLVGKHLAVEAAKHVQTITITKAGELCIPAARRFANAEVVNILCLLQGTGEMDEVIETEQYTISEAASNRIPSFISSFPKLKRSFLGGVLLQEGRATNVRYGNVYYRCAGPDNHREVFRNLVRSLFGAFKTGALRRGVEFHKLAWSLHDVWSCAEDTHDLDTNPCQRCRDCIQYLPLEDSINAFVFKYPRCGCLDADAIWRLLLEQPGIEMSIKCASERVLCRVVRQELRIGRIIEESERAVERLSQKWCFDSQWPLRLRFLPESAFERLDDLMKRGLDPGQISLRYFFEQMCHLIGPRVITNNTKFGVWSKSTVEGLAARGFPVDCDSVPVIEDRFLINHP